jgi:hypothetical protein
MKVQLRQLAWARSGDKGDSSNIGLIARHPALYPFLKKEVTSGRVRDFFQKICRGEVERFEVDNLYSLNFILHDSLGGGGSESLKIDAQGKTHGEGLLRLEVELPESLHEFISRVS